MARGRPARGLAANAVGMDAARYSGRCAFLVGPPAVWHTAVRGFRCQRRARGVGRRGDEPANGQYGACQQEMPEGTRVLPTPLP